MKGETWLSRFFGYVPAAERKGLCLPPGHHWEVKCPQDFPGFLRALPELLPDGSVLYIESDVTPDETEAYLRARPSANALAIEMGTIWPRPERFHMDATPENIDGLATIEDTHASPLGSIHVHVYKDNAIIVQGYDAFLDPFYISEDVPEDKVRAFCDRLGVKYRRTSVGQ